MCFQEKSTSSSSHSHWKYFRVSLNAALLLLDALAPGSPCLWASLYMPCTVNSSLLR